MRGKYIGGKYIGGKYIGKTKYKCKFRPPISCRGDDEQFDSDYQSSIMRLERYENIKDSIDRLREIDPENRFTSKIIKVCPIGDLTEEEGADQFTECQEEVNLLKEKVYPFKDDDELVNIIQKYEGESIKDSVGGEIGQSKYLELLYNYNEIIDILIILRDNDFCLTGIKDVFYDFQTHQYNINELGWSFDMKSPINIQLAMFALGDNSIYPYFDLLTTEPEERGVNRKVPDIKILIHLYKKLTENESLLTFIQLIKEIRPSVKKGSIIISPDSITMIILSAPNNIWPPDIGITLLLQHILKSLDKHPDEVEFITIIKYIFLNIYSDYNIVSVDESDPAVLIGKAKEFISNSLNKFDTYALGMSNFLNYFLKGSDIIKGVFSKKELYDEFNKKLFNLYIELINPNPIDRISLEETKVKYSEIKDIFKGDVGVQLAIHRLQLPQFEEEYSVDKWSCDIEEGCIKKPFGKYTSSKECDLKCIDCFDGIYQDEDVFECPQCHNKICKEFLKGIIRVSKQPNIQEIAVSQPVLKLLSNAAEIIIVIDELVRKESNPVLKQVTEKAILTVGQVELQPEQLPTNEELYIIWNEMKKSGYFTNEFTVGIQEGHYYSNELGWSFDYSILRPIIPTLNELSVLLTLNLSEDGMNIHQYPYDPPKCPYCRKILSNEWISENLD